MRPNDFVRRLCLWISLLVMSVLYLVPQEYVYATGEFQADYDVQYAIAPTGKTIVTQHVTLTNKLSDYYPKQYSLLLDSDKISNVIAYDDGGIITPAISIKDGKTDITLAFNVKAIGLGKTSSFSLRYEHSGIASQNGSIWEVYVPGITNDPDIGAYNVTVAVPPTFGPAAYLSPLPATNDVWDKAQMIRGGISGAYGSAQNFAVTLRYALSNTAMVPQTQIIALPPDSALQKVTLQSLDPSPQTVSRDTDGNWLAQYDLLPTQSKTITAKMNISTYLTPRPDFQSPTVDPSVFLKPQQYWEVTDPKIQALAKLYSTPRQIYDYVSTALTYNYGRVSTTTARLGALGVLAHPDQAICMEFTDLFIAIARAAGIPARRDVGYAYTNNPKLRPLSLVSDVLHAWPEYYDATQKMWVPVDPTWANTTGGADYFTKLDFNHIIFAVNGVDSSLPYPAGFYHSAADPAKDVDVTFAQTAPKELPAHITSAIEFPAQVGAGTNATGDILVSNKGGESAYTIAVSAASNIGNIKLSQVIPEMLPYATVRLPLKASMPQTFTSLHGTITAQVNDATLTQDFTVRPIIWLMATIGVFGVASLAIIMKLGHMLLWKLFKKR